MHLHSEFNFTRFKFLVWTFNFKRLVDFEFAAALVFKQYNTIQIPFISHKNKTQIEKNPDHLIPDKFK